jgi:exopolyphosphatase/pppGpp-phosphohydrolase
VKEKTGLSVKLINRQEEGRLGFNTVVLGMKKRPDEILCWDLGAGSFQISSQVDRNIEVFGAEIGATTTFRLLCEMRGHSTIPQTINPVSYEEMMALSEKIKSYLPPTPMWLSDKNRQLIGYGSSTGLFAMGCMATGKKSFSKSELLMALKEIAGKTDHELQALQKSLEIPVILTLLYTIMDYCKINQLEHFESSGGNTTGILLNPDYWA